MVVLILSLSTLASAEERVGRIYPLGSPTTGDPLYTLKMHRETKGDQEGCDAKIEDRQGSVIMTEHALMKAGKIQFQRVDQLQMGKSYEVEVKDGKMIYRTFELSGSQRTLTAEKSHALPPTFITGPAAEVFLKEKLLQPGSPKEVRADFGVMEIERSVEFEFRRREPASVEPAKGEPGPILVRMRPSNLFFSMMVDPIDMYFDPKGFSIVEYKGQMPIKKMVDGKWKPFAADVIYSPAPLPASAPAAAAAK